MRAVVLEEHGGPEVLQIREVEPPTAAPEEVLVAVTATALNRADLLQRMGFYPGPPMPHEIPGMEFAGTVSACGDRVTGVSVGDSVMGIVGGGAYAEQIAVHHRQVMPVPDSVALTDAAAIPEVFITAWDALVRQGELAPGGTCLIHAGASGVGTAAIQVAKRLGATVIVTASTNKIERCMALGADLAIDYTAEDFAGAVRAFSPRGVDMVLCVIGGDYLARNVSCLATGGTIVQVGVMGEGTATFPIGALLPLRATIRGTVLRARPLEEKIAVTQRFRREVWPGFDAGELHPVIDRRFALADIASAHEYMASNASIGKILIDM